MRCYCDLFNSDLLKYTDFRDGAQNSCRRCDLIQRVILDVVNGCLPSVFQGPRDELERTRILDEMEISTNFLDKRELSFCITGHRWVTVLLFRDSEQSSLRVGYLELPKLVQFGPRTNSDRAFDRAAQWLQNCLKNHDCGRVVPGRRYPKRLLDLREDKIRLFQTVKPEHRPAPYVCLSHRWGDIQHRRLISTVSTVENHMKGIAWDDLPKTFQDAVIICRRMGIDYLWIDSLCILQECAAMSEEDIKKTKADFAQENSAMASIYRNSLFTIYASISTSMDSGVFSEHSIHQMRVINDDGNEALCCIREKTSHKLTRELDTRCWTYQEYLLSPRVLDFGPFDITWRCQKSQACECGEFSGESSFAFWRPEAFTKQAIIPQDIGGAVEWWWMVLRFYAMRKLTIEDDKLPALSGMAQVYHEVTHDAYLAGLWKSSLPHALCWYYKKIEFPEDIDIGCRPKKCRAPSWSWASVDTMKDSECYHWLKGIDREVFRDQRVVCTVYEAACELKTHDPFGAVSGGFIELGVILIAANIGKESSGRYWSSKVGGQAWTLSYVEDGTYVQRCVPDCNLEHDNLRLGDRVYCAPILEHLHWDSSHRGCLVLKQEGEYYRRIGFCILLNNHVHSTTSEFYGSQEENEKEYALQYHRDLEVRIRIR
ncbi:heterokaryon incompatibility protein-domain-containing protein [Xylaria flabelliformis]|nr:heterokaryon incompatibility protein-domain-containing protein [Xylaria flabelliformis]